MPWRFNALLSLPELLRCLYWLDFFSFHHQFITQMHPPSFQPQSISIYNSYMPLTSIKIFVFLTFEIPIINVKLLIIVASLAAAISAAPAPAPAELRTRQFPVGGVCFILSRILPICNFSDLENRLAPLMNIAEVAKSQSMDHLPPWVVTLIGL